jgi:hypothetical protein
MATILCLFALDAHAKAFPYKDRVKASYMKLPLAFVKNEGQRDTSVLFYELSGGHSTAFTMEGVTLYLNKNKSTEAVTLTPLDASSFSGEGREKKEGKVNYLIGSDPAKWKTNIPTYGAIYYKNVYPGIDMKFYGTNSELEYDLIVSPGADPSGIRLSYKGIERLSLTSSGELEIALKRGSLFQRKPHVYQMIDGKKVEAEGKFLLAGGTTYGFTVAAYDKKYALVIDPVLAYSTYLGGTSNDASYAVAVDSTGHAYVTGTTRSAGFPVTTGAFQTAHAADGGGFDVFVTKLSPSGDSLIYSTYLGGNGFFDIGNGIAVDSTGHAYVTGATQSSNFPVTAGAFQTVYGGGGFYDVFVTKIGPNGDSLVYSTYIGGATEDYGAAIALDPLGSAYVTGRTLGNDFPVTAGAYQVFSRGVWDAFVTKLSPSGDSLVYSTYLGGGSWDYGNGIALDASNNAYVTGYTQSANFPVTAGAFQILSGGGHDAFITKLAPNGDSLIYSTYLGGAGEDHGNGIALDASDNAYVTGYTASANFPVTGGALQTVRAGNKDAFVAKLGTAGDSLVYSTYLGGTGDDFGNGIALDASDNVYVTGYTASANFPVTAGAFQGTLGGSNDVFLTGLGPNGDSLVYSTYLGGTGDDQAFGIALDAEGSVYLTGLSTSTSFPVTTGSFQATSGGSYDAFVARFASSVTLTVSKSGTGSGTVTSDTGGINCGSTCSAGFAPGTVVNLTATPASGSTFAGWSGACTGSATCAVTMSTGAGVTAAFTANVTVTASVSGGHGTVSPPSQSVAYGGTASITMTPDTGYRIASLTDNGVPVNASGLLRTGSGKKAAGPAASQKKLSRAAIPNPYSISNVVADHAVVVTYGIASANLTATMSGQGVGRIEAQGLTCTGLACTGTYDYGTSVTLTAIAGSDSTFTGWSGACTGTGTCTVTMTEARNVTATFDSCAYTVSSSSKSFPYRGSSTNVTVHANGTNCVTPVISASDSWVTASMGRFSNNRGTLRITTSANETITRRDGTVTVHTSPFAVAQAGCPCSLTSIYPTNDAITHVGGTGSFTVHATQGCEWNVASPDWVIATASGTGTGPVSYTAASNSTGRPRKGTINVALSTAPTKKKAFTVSQSACTLSISPPPRHSFDANGGDGSFTVNAPPGCTWNVTSSEGWLTADTSAGSGSGAVSYSASPNPTAGQRIGKLNVSLTETPAVKTMFTVTVRR